MLGPFAWASLQQTKNWKCRSLFVAPHIVLKILKKQNTQLFCKNLFDKNIRLKTAQIKFKNILRTYWGWGKAKNF